MRTFVEKIDEPTLNHARAIDWESYAPFLTNEHVQEFRSGATEDERAELAEMFAVADVVGRKSRGDVLATSLFWKNVDKNGPDLPTPTRRLLQDAAELGLVKRHHPWNHYVLPVLRGSAKLARSRPDVTVRVYLANDLSFLIPDLVEHCEVYLMKSSSLRHSPGALWRYLSLAPGEQTVTIIDADMMESDGQRILHYTDRLEGSGVETWRHPKAHEIDANRHFVYRPIMGWGVGTRVSLDATALLSAFIWHYRRGSFAASVTLPDVGQIRHFAKEWPGYNIDEWFLSAAAYPRLLQHGFLTLTGAETATTMFPLDRELARRCNDRSRCGSL